MGDLKASASKEAIKYGVFLYKKIQKKRFLTAVNGHEKVETMYVLTNTKIHRIIYRMKVTAIIADDLVNNVKAYTRSSTVTEAITIVLKDWLDIYNIKELNKEIGKNPIIIENGQKIRETNRTK